jgi:hypothetical protein
MVEGVRGPATPTVPSKASAPRIRVSRTTKQPRKRRAKGEARAQQLLRRITPEQFRVAARLTREQLGVLDEIAAGRAPRNASAVIHAIDTKIAYAYSKPAQVHDVNLSTSYTDLVAGAGESPPSKTEPVESTEKGQEAPTIDESVGVVGVGVELPDAPEGSQ